MKHNDISSMIMAAVIGVVFSLTNIFAVNVMAKTFSNINQNNDNVKKNLQVSREYIDSHNGTLETIIVNAAEDSDR